MQQRLSADEAGQFENKLKKFNVLKIVKRDKAGQFARTSITTDSLVILAGLVQASLFE